jgi:enterobactin synthetase component D
MISAARGSAIARVDFPMFDGELGVTVVAFELGGADEMVKRWSSCASLPVELANAVPKRRAEYLAGRAAAALALADAGCKAPDAVGRNRDGSPSWPEGFVGSITHGGGIAAAAVARGAKCIGIGIDAELVMPESTREEVGPLVVSTAEIGLAQRALSMASPASLVTLVFSAKESLYKCLRPIVGSFFEFADAELVDVRPDSGKSGTFCVELRRTLSDEFRAGRRQTGQFRFEGGRVETALGMKRGST